MRTSKVPVLPRDEPEAAHACPKAKRQVLKVCVNRVSVLVLETSTVARTSWLGYGVCFGRHEAAFKLLRLSIRIQARG